MLVSVGLRWSGYVVVVIGTCTRDDDDLQDGMKETTASLYTNAPSYNHSILRGLPDSRMSQYLRVQPPSHRFVRHNAAGCRPAGADTHPGGCGGVGPCGRQRVGHLRAVRPMRTGGSPTNHQTSQMCCSMRSTFPHLRFHRAKMQQIRGITNVLKGTVIFGREMLAERVTPHTVLGLGN